mmetsp:Transcript_87427/g.245410  ORF Transcript_87427/g.245410 Transcript_87427/m.245410 type:complete len:132 (+) Transcript_87427:217-612(+)
MNVQKYADPTVVHGLRSARCALQVERQSERRLPHLLKLWRPAEPAMSPNPTATAKDEEECPPGQEAPTTTAGVTSSTRERLARASALNGVSCILGITPPAEGNQPDATASIAMAPSAAAPTTNHVSKDAAS